MKKELVFKQGGKMKKIVGLLLIIVLALTGCGTSNQNTDRPFSGTTLNVYNWGDYIAEDTIRLFEEETGMKVNYELFDSNEIMYSKYKSGAVDYDVLIPSDYMIEKLIEEDELLELNMDNIPNAKFIDEKFKGLAFDSEDLYSIPYMWGTVGILYNTTMVSEEINSWNELFDAKYEGQIVMQNSVRDAAMVALKNLGYSLNSTNQEEIDEAFELLKEQSSLVQAYVNDEVRDKMIGEEAALAVIYSGEAQVTMEANENLAFVNPSEGTNLWFDAMVIPKSTRNKEAAEAFINYMCKTEIAYNNCDYIGYATPHIEAYKLLDEEVKNNSATYPSEDILSNCEVYVDLGPEMTQYYNEKWTEMKLSFN